MCIKEENNKTERLSWRVEEVARATGLSIQFIWKQIRLNKLKVRKLGRCVLVLDEDLKMYLRGAN